MQETQGTWVQSPGQEDALEEEMATHSSILDWKIPWMEEPGGLLSIGSQRVRHDWSDLTRMHSRHYSQDTKHFCDSKRFLCASLQLIPPSQATIDWPFFREKN